MMTRRSLLGAGAALALATPATLLRAGNEPRLSFNATRFDDVCNAVKHAVASRDVPGALSLVWQGGELRCMHAAGVRSIETGAPMTMDTIMGLASMTKPITVATAMALVERGRMRLSDPITRFAPEFANMRVLRR